MDINDGSLSCAGHRRPAPERLVLCLLRAPDDTPQDRRPIPPFAWISRVSTRGEKVAAFCGEPLAIFRVIDVTQVAHGAEINGMFFDAILDVVWVSNATLAGEYNNAPSKGS